MHLARAAFVAAVVLLFLLFVACDEPAAQQSADAEEEMEEAEELPEPEEEESVEYPLTVIDDVGREVVVPARPERIISFDPGATDILLHLDTGSRLVGVDDYSSVPEDLRGLPRLGGAVNQDVESMLALQPDLVLTTDGMDRLLSVMTNEDVSVLVLDAASFSDVLANVRLIAEAVGVPRRGEGVVGEMKESVGAVAEKVGGVREEDRPVVFYEVWPDPLMTEGADSLVDFLIDAAGGVNAAGHVSGSWVSFSTEELAEIDPDVILTPFSDTVLELQRGEREGWESLAAVRNERFHQIDSARFARRSPRMVEGLQEVARLLHPDRFQ